MKFPKLYTIVILLSVMLANIATSQTNDGKYTFVNIDKGATQRAVTSILQDNRGLIWMGTNGVGLYKYNGLEYKTYKHVANDSTAINSSLVYSVYMDSSDKIWVGTIAGLNVYDPMLDMFKEIKLDQDAHTKDNIPVYAITENKSGELFIGTNENGLIKLNRETLKYENIVVKGGYKASDLVINSLICDVEDNLYVGTNRGLFTYKNKNNYLEPAKFQTMNGNTTITFGIESLLHDKEGNLWVGTYLNGLIKIVKGANNDLILNTYEITNKRILTLLQEPDGNILCGTENDGLFVLKTNGEIVNNYRYDKFEKNSIKSNSIWSLFVDDQERIWIGYYNKGVGVHDRYYDKFMEIESSPNLLNSLQSTSVNGIVHDDSGKLWVGMDGGGVDIYNPENKNFIHLSNPNNGLITGLESFDVQTIFVDSKGNVWVGTWSSGIYYLEKNSKTFISYNKSNTNGGLTSNRIMSFSEDARGNIWIGTFFNGLHLYDVESKKFSSQSGKPFNEALIGESNIRIVLVDSKNAIWLGTTSGLYRVVGSQESGFKVQSMNEMMFMAQEDKNTSSILSLFEDSDNNVWIGTDGIGLFKYNRAKDMIEWYNKTKGLVQETVASIIEDDYGNLWLGGEAGLSKLDMAKGTFSNFTTNDGLLANDFNYNSVYKDNSGILYFGSYEGINYFDPTKILRNINEPSLYFSDFKLFNKSVKPGSNKSPLDKVISETEHLTLSHKESVFTLEFAGINYTRPQNNQYAYYLEGFETTWNYVGNTRNATYTNLSPGDYIFKVKAANNDGLWNETPLSLGITILPPWWGTNTAIFSYIILFLLFSYFLSKFINQRLREKRLIKFERDQRLQEEILNERKIQFFTNISHEFRTPLTLILNPLRDIIANNNLQLNDSVMDKHKIILKNTMRLMRLIDELMDFRKLHLTKMSINASKINAMSFVKEISGHFQEEVIEKNILFSVETYGMPAEIWGYPGMLEKVIFNILSNAFKATPDNGVITVGVFNCNDPVLLPLIDEQKPVSALEIIIEDTGMGIKKEEIDHIFKRFYQSTVMNHKYYGGSGTGIGLEVAQSFIMLHKGKIEVESKEGEGTKFRIYLPFGNGHLKTSELLLVNNKVGPLEDIIISESDRGHPSDATQIIANEIPIVENKRTLLIVEDNLGLRNYLKGELENEYIIIEAENGRKGVELAVSRIPDIIITDIIMPEMDGIEFCSTIKHDIKTSHIPVLMITAKAMSDDRVKGIDSGADAYLNKPFEMKVLRAYLKRLIDSRQNFLNRFFKDINNITLPEKTTSLDRSFITKVLKYINENIDDADLNVEQLSDDMHLSRSQLYRKIKAMTGMTANEFIRKIRLEKAKQMIENGSESISEVGFKVGFSSPSYFTKCFKSHFGILPTEVKPF